MIVIIDYGMGNIGSIKNMLKKIGAASEIVNNPGQISNCSGLILPGVGAFDLGMELLNNSGFADYINDQVVTKQVPLLGICLGMQLLFDSSEEGKSNGLGIIEGDIKKFSFNNGTAELKVPHMGWNYIACKEDTLFHQLGETAKFYFIHSYHVPADNPSAIATCDYGYKFAAAVRKDNIYGVQFHPEKSHRYGMKLLSNFACMADIRT